MLYLVSYDYLIFLNVMSTSYNAFHGAPNSVHYGDFSPLNCGKIDIT